MHPFTVLVLRLTVRFLSSFPDSLPQLFLRCLPILPSQYFPFPFRFLSSASVLLPTTQPSVSLFPFYLFLPHSGCLSICLPLSLPTFPRYLLPDFSCIPSRFPYSTYCWFPFVLPCFAPAAVPQVIPFDCSFRD